MAGKVRQGARCSCKLHRDPARAACQCRRSTSTARSPQERPSACCARRRACAAGTNATGQQHKIDNFSVFYMVLFTNLKSTMKSTIFISPNSAPLSALCSAQKYFKVLNMIGKHCSSFIASGGCARMRSRTFCGPTTPANTSTGSV